MHATAQSDHLPSMLINCAGAFTSKPRPNTCLQQPRHPTPSHNLTNNTATQKQLCAQTQSHLNSSLRKVTTARIQNQQVRMHTSLHNSASAFCVRMQHTQTGLRRGQPNESTGSRQTSAASKSAHLSIWHLPSGHTNLSAIQKTHCDHDACMKQKWLMQS